MQKLENKTVFITGGLSGIGKACAIAAAQEGANIAIADLYTSETDNEMLEVKSYDPKAIFIDCDVSYYKQAESAIRKVVSTFGRLDVALNNAGIGGVPNKIGDILEHDWHKVIGVNLNGVFNCMKHELTQMSKQKKGVIVNMSSILGKVAFAQSGHYVAAKHAVIGLTKTAALEYATEGIRINSICPAFIETPLIENAGIKKNSELEKYIISLHPMKRLGKPEEIATVFVFLASGDGSFMTGTSVDVDGGYLVQ